MTAQPAEDWQPGDPLFRDQGPGQTPHISVTAAERASDFASEAPPTWAKVAPPTPTRVHNAECKPCGVKWIKADSNECWCCGQVPWERQP